MSDEYFLEDEPQKAKILNFVSTDGDVFILGEFDDSISQNVIPALVKHIEEIAEEKNPYIRVYINSNGGQAKQLWALLSLFTMAKLRGIKIITINIGFAYSCGSMLAICGDERYMFKYARNLMHLGRQGDDVTTFKQIDRVNKSMKEHFETIVDVYKKHTKMPEEMIRKEISDDSYFLNADECLKYGFVDKIIEEPNELDIGMKVNGKEKPIELDLCDGDELVFNNCKFKVKLKEKDKKKLNKSKNERKK